MPGQGKTRSRSRSRGRARRPAGATQPTQQLQTLSVLDGIHLQGQQELGQQLPCQQEPGCQQEP
eukprot:8053051-Alexandrium_andersonii.AAC.1